MKTQKIHIDEENTHLLWGLITVFSIASATYMLTNAFMAGSWSIAGYTQLISLGLFSIGFYGIIKLSSPLFRFVLFVSDSTLVIEIWQDGDEPIGIQKIALNTISELRIAPHTPRSSNEALFDFSTSYYLLYRDDKTQDFKRLIALEGESFTLKVEDIHKIMEYLATHHSEMHIPQRDAVFVKMNY